MTTVSPHIFNVRVSHFGHIPRAVPMFSGPIAHVAFVHVRTATLA
jgi:hypothetical protein